MATETEEKKKLTGRLSVRHVRGNPVSSDAEHFLRYVLPSLGRMQENVDILSRYARSSEHRDAARDLLRDLCNNLQMFPSVGLPALLGPDEPMPVNPFEDRAWLSDIGYLLDDQLQPRTAWWKCLFGEWFSSKYLKLHRTPGCLQPDVL
jgi:hypothetical protein